MACLLWQCFHKLILGISNSTVHRITIKALRGCKRYLTNISFTLILTHPYIVYAVRVSLSQIMFAHTVSFRTNYVLLERSFELGVLYKDNGQSHNDCIANVDWTGYKINSSLQIIVFS